MAILIDVDNIVDFCFSILNSTEIKNKKMGIFTTQTNFLLIQKKLFVHKGFTHFGRAFMSTNMLYYIGKQKSTILSTSIKIAIIILLLQTKTFWVQNHLLSLDILYNVKILRLHLSHREQRYISFL